MIRLSGSFSDQAVKSALWPDIVCCGGRVILRLHVGILQEIAIGSIEERRKTGVCCTGTRVVTVVQAEKVS